MMPTSKRTQSMLVALAAVGLALLGRGIFNGGLALADGLEPITDLPFFDIPGGDVRNGNGRRVNCVWHFECGDDVNAEQGQPDGRAIDFRARPQAIWPLHAAGNGTVVTSHNTRDSAGEYIVIDHPGDHSSDYMHLNTRMARSGMDVCRYVTIGYAGMSGTMNYPAHIHFGTTTADRFPDIYGNRPNGELAEGDFTHNANVHHTCDGDCSDETNAYTVDDTQNPSWCASCSVAEFTIDGFWGLRPGGGYAYFDRRRGSYHMTEMQQSGDPVSKATFQPDVKVEDSDWDVWVFVPVLDEDANAHRDRVSTAVRTKLVWYDENENKFQRFVNINQNFRGGEWVDISGNEEVGTHWLPGTPNRPAPLAVEVTNERNCGDDCPRGIALVDAAVFIPSICDPGE